jgi:hypothetical protein
MEIELLINDEDRTSLVNSDSIRATDIINDREGLLEFEMFAKIPSDDLLTEASEFLVQEDGSKLIITAEAPIQINDEVELWVDGTKVFGGLVSSIKAMTRGNRNVYWQVEAMDYTIELNRVLITERYEDMTANAIIADLISQLNEEADDTFTTTNVDAPTTITSISFNRLSVRQCIEKIASLLNYYWYVDYDRDIHFFAMSDEVAPFALTDSNGNYLYDSLVYEENLDQLRNVVLLEGAEIEGTTREEVYRATDNQKAFPLANKFASLPTVKINGSSVTVGIDFITADTAMSVAWNYNQKYLRFISELNSTQTVLVSGIPLYPLIVQLQDSTSISLYGVYQFTKKDRTVRTRDEAVELANAQLDAYATPTVTGSFKTYTAGLKAGQVISIQSDVMGLNDFYLIDRVSLTIDAVDRVIYNVSFVSVKTQGIVSVLQGLLTPQELTEGEQEQILSFAQVSTSFSATGEVTDTTVTSDPYVYDTAKWNMSVWA